MCAVSRSYDAANPTTTEDPMAVEVDQLKQTVEGLGRQVLLSKLFWDERTRSDGDSGFKQSRDDERGTRSYYSGTGGKVTHGWDNDWSDNTLGN